MKQREIDYYLTMNSPWSYMGSQRLWDMADRYDCKVNVYPTKFAQVFKQTGGLPLEMRATARKDYRQVELVRWREYLGIALNIRPEYFPVADTNAAHAVIAAQVNGLDALLLATELGRAQWELQQDFSQVETIESACKRAGMNLKDLGETGTQGDQFQANTDEAVNSGVFGYPAYILDGELFWGQDRLDFLERKLENSKTGTKTSG